jgi:Mannitol repressor
MRSFGRCSEARDLQQMVNLSKEDHDTLFLGLGPLASFRAKTQLAFALGIIGPKTRHDLDSMREIRNALAHTGLKIDFDTPEVAALCGGLHALSLVGKPVDKPGPLPPRNQYTAVTKVLLIRLIDTFAQQEDRIPRELGTWE